MAAKKSDDKISTEEDINLSGFSTVHLDCAHSVLQERRLILELTQKQIAERAKIPLSTYQKFETGERNIRTAAFEVTCRVLNALELDIEGFYHGIYAIGEEVYIDEEGQKYVRTGRLTSEEIDDDEAINVVRVHIVDRSLIIPLKLLRIINKPDKIHLMYHKDDRRFGIRALKESIDGAIYISRRKSTAGNGAAFALKMMCSSTLSTLSYREIQEDTL